jgi:FAD/FMN-containing dehydrogenase
VADVITTVHFARDNGSLLAVRGGGHNGPGLGSCDGGVVIDLSLMKGVRVDPATRLVRVGPGCTQGDMDHATHAFGLAVPAVAPRLSPRARVGWRRPVQRST